MLAMTATGVSSLIRAVGAFAWPVAVVIVVVVLRAPIGRLLDRIRHAKWGPAEVALVEAAEIIHAAETAPELDPSAKEVLSVVRARLDTDVARLAALEHEAGRIDDLRLTAARMAVRRAVARVDMERVTKAENDVTREPPGSGPQSGS